MTIATDGVPGPTGSPALDDLEFALRRLPGVRAVGFTATTDLLLVRLHVTAGNTAPDLPTAAARLAGRSADRPVAIEVVRAGAGPLPTPVANEAPAAGDITARPRLLAVLAFPETDEIEVHLAHAGRRVVGRARAGGGLAAAAEATTAALHELDGRARARVRWARVIDDERDDRVAVAVAVDQGDGETCLGLAAGSSPIDAAARSALDACNRRFTRR